MGGLAPTEDDLARLVIAGARHRWRYSARVATLYTDRRRAAAQKTIRAVGIEHLQRAVARGCGVVLASVHLSDFDLGGSWLAQVRGYEVVAVVGGPCSRLRQAAFHRLRRSCGIHIRYEDETSLADLMDDLGRRRIVSLMLDRQPAYRGSEIEFLGRTATMSRVPLVLARRSGAPVVVAGMKGHAGGHLIRFAAVDDIGPALDRRAWMQSLAHQLEDLVRWAPEQWHIPPDVSQLPWGMPR